MKRSSGSTSAALVALLCAAAFVLEPSCSIGPEDTRALSCQEAADLGFPCDEAGKSGAAGENGSGGVGGLGGAGQGGSGAGGTGGGGTGGSSGAGCTMPQIDCGGACTDVQSDAANCGACGYACETGRLCESGTCQPLAIVEDATAPYAFVLDTESVYFVVPVKEPGDVIPPPVQKAPRSGGTTIAVPFAGNPTFRSRSLALVGSTLFFGDLDNNGVLRKGATTGGDVTTFLSAQPAVQHLVVADSQLWWSAFNGTSFVRRVASPLDPFPALADELAFQTGRIDMLVVDGSGASAVVYWANRDVSPSDNKSGLWRKAEGTNAEALVAGGQMVALALGADGVYVADATAGIGKAAKDAPEALTEVVAPNAVGGTVQGLAVTATHLYWLAFNEGQLELHRSALDGTEARVLGRVAVALPAYWAAPIGPSQLVVDGGHVYFSDVGSVTGNTAASNPGLEGVTGLADGAIYRLPE